MSEQNNNKIKPVCCPYCASTQVAPVERSYDGGLGCIGLLLFGWWGLLLGLLGGGTDMYCMNCGRRWNPRTRAGGCVTLIFILILIALLAAIFD